MITKIIFTGDITHMHNESRPPYFPMMIDIHDKDILIIGGGHVAARRAKTLLTCGAKVHAVSREFIDGFPECTERITREFRPEDIDSRFIFVIAATDSRETNKIIHDTAKSGNIPVNVSDCQSECDFFFPSLITHENFSVSVNSAGLSSSITRRLSERLRCIWSSWVEDEKVEDEKIKSLS